MNSFPDVCFKLAEISETLEPEHYFYFFTMFGFVFICEFLVHLIDFFVQFSFKIRDERKALKKLSSQNDIK